MPTIELKYAPQSYQREWHDISTPLLALVCGRQIGKTVFIVEDLIIAVLAYQPSIEDIDPLSGVVRFWYITNDYTQAERNVWDLFMNTFPKELNPKIDKSKLTITVQKKLANGDIVPCRIELIGVENAEKLRGAKVYKAVCDEYDDFPSFVYPTIIEPMFSTTNGRRTFVGSPKGFRNLYSLYTSGMNNLTVKKLASCVLRDDQRTVISVTSKYAKIEVIQQALDRAWLENDFDTFAQEYLADFNKPKGVVYKSWNIDNFKDVPYDPTLPLHVSFDWGVNDPTVALWIQPTKTEIRVIDYYEMKDGSIDQLASVLNSKPYKRPALYTGDPAGTARELTTGISPIDMLKKYNIHVRTKYGVTIPEQIRLANQYIPTLVVDRTNAERFKDVLLNYRYPIKKETALNQSNEIPIHDEWSHGARTYEYWATNYREIPTTAEYGELPVYQPTWSKTGY